MAFVGPWKCYLSKDVSLANCLAGQENLPPEQRADLLTVQYNEDNVSVCSQDQAFGSPQCRVPQQLGQLTQCMGSSP